MRTLLQVVGVESPAGHALPEILPQLTGNQVVFRQAQLHLVAAQPGGGKTMLALWYAITSKTPALYFSADSDSRTIALRAGAILMDRSVTDVERMMDSEASVLLEDALADGAGHIRFSFDPSPSLQDIEEEIEAWIELHGAPPSAIYIDNLMNVAAVSDNEWTALRDAMSAFHYMAREQIKRSSMLRIVSLIKTIRLIPLILWVGWVRWQLLGSLGYRRMTRLRRAVITDMTSYQYWVNLYRLRRQHYRN